MLQDDGEELEEEERTKRTKREEQIEKEREERVKHLNEWKVTCSDVHSPHLCKSIILQLFVFRRWRTRILL